MLVELLLIANSIFLIVILLLLTLTSQNSIPKKRNRFKVKDDIAKIKEQISN